MRLHVLNLFLYMYIKHTWISTCTCIYIDTYNLSTRTICTLKCQWIFVHLHVTTWLAIKECFSPTSVELRKNDHVMGHKVVFCCLRNRGNQVTVVRGIVESVSSWVTWSLWMSCHSKACSISLKTFQLFKSLKTKRVDTFIWFLILFNTQVLRLNRYYLFFHFLPFLAYTSASGKPLSLISPKIVSSTAALVPSHDHFISQFRGRSRKAVNGCSSRNDDLIGGSVYWKNQQQN